jgi:hypothetical protein
MRSHSVRAATLQRRTRDRERRPVADVEQLRHDRPQRRETRGVAGTDDCPQDDFQRDLGHLRGDREVGARRPTSDVVRGDRRHLLGLLGHGVTMERRQHQAAPVAMYGVVDHQHRGVSQHSGQHGVGLAGVKDGRVTCEYFLDLGGNGQIDHRRRHRGADGEHLAVAPPACGDEPRPVAHEDDRLEPLRKPGARWQR